MTVQQDGRSEVGIGVNSFFSLVLQAVRQTQRMINNSMALIFI